MMKSFLSLSIGALFFAVTATNPVTAAPDDVLPFAVRASVPQKSTSFLLERLPIGDKGAFCLVHIWGAVRPNTPDSFNYYNAYWPSPFCVDIFEPSTHTKKQPEWHLVNSTTYTDVAPPTRIISHWLHPLAKQGPILEIISSNGAPGLSVQHTLFVWDKGLNAAVTPPLPQIFSTGGIGGGLITLNFAVASKDTTTIKVSNSYVGKAISTTDYHWNGERFAAIKVLR